MSNQDSSANTVRTPRLRVNGLSKIYRRSRVPWHESEDIVAARDISLEIFAGETLAVVGRSGSGKSTVARCIVQLEKPDSGTVWLEGVEIAQVNRRELQSVRSRLQMIFQDTAASMNPRFTAAQVIEEPLLIRGIGDKSARRERAVSLMLEVGLTPQWADRRVTDFSGGQQQRLAIARALSLGPKLLVLDEAFSGLDLSTEAQIVNLLLDLQEVHSLSYLLISHDIALVARLADRIAVMMHGEIIEQGPTAAVLASNDHAETRALLASARTAQANLAALGVGS